MADKRPAPPDELHPNRFASLGAGSMAAETPAVAAEIGVMHAP